MSLAPIAIFVYNRPWHTAQTIEALKKNMGAKNSDLIIFSDGSKLASDENVINVRNYIKGVNGFRSINIIEREKNIGLAKSIIDGVSYILSYYDKIIVLEDDLVTSPYFLSYMNEALDKYSENERVASIHGYVYPVKGVLPEAFFLRGADCWGWATWRRGWAIFNHDCRVILSQLHQRNLIREFDFNGNYLFSKMLNDQIEEKNQSWAVRWHASAFLADKLTLHPGRSLIKNIGNDATGTHCGATSIFDVSLSDSPINLDLVKLVEPSRLAYDHFEQFYKGLHTGFAKRALNRLKKIASKIKTIIF